MKSGTRSASCPACSNSSTTATVRPGRTSTVKSVSTIVSWPGSSWDVPLVTVVVLVTAPVVVAAGPEVGAALVVAAGPLVVAAGPEVGAALVVDSAASTETAVTAVCGSRSVCPCTRTSRATSVSTPTSRSGSSPTLTMTSVIGADAPAGYSDSPSGGSAIMASRTAIEPIRPLAPLTADSWSAVWVTWPVPQPASAPTSRAAPMARRRC